MKVITSELINRITQMNKMYKYISVVVDYDKEEEYSSMRNEIIEDLEKMEFTPKDIDSILNIVDEEEAEQYYIYEPEEIIEMMFEDNQLLISAFYWIEGKQQVNWLCLNVFHTREYYNAVDNLNDNYIISTVEF